MRMGEKQKSFVVMKMAKMCLLFWAFHSLIGSEPHIGSFIAVEEQRSKQKWQTLSFVWGLWWNNVAEHFHFRCMGCSIMYTVPITRWPRHFHVILLAKVAIFVRCCQWCLTRRGRGRRRSCRVWLPSSINEKNVALFFRFVVRVAGELSVVDRTRMNNLPSTAIYTGTGDLEKF